MGLREGGRDRGRDKVREGREREEGVWRSHPSSELIYCSDSD